jgi:hypothetical protein
MSRFLLNDGRIAWAPFSAFIASCSAALAGDYVWRVSAVPGAAIAGACALIFAGSAAATIIDWRKRVREGRSR